MSKLLDVFRVYGLSGGFLLIFYKLFYSKLQAFKSSLEVLEWAKKNQSTLISIDNCVRLQGVPGFPDKEFSFRPMTSDPLVLRQHFFSQELKPVLDYFKKSGKELKLMIDAGGNIGASACFMHWHFPGLRSLVLEPSHGNAQIAKINLMGCNSEIWKRALWWKEDQLKFDESRTAWAMRVSQSTTGREVEAITLSSILKKAEFSNPDYIKIDIEGAEEEVFEMDEKLKGLLGKVSCISVEPHSEKGIILIQNKLNEWGYTVKFHGELIIGFR